MIQVKLISDERKLAAGAKNLECHMECNSIHSAIESASAQKEIEFPSHYVKVIKEARKRQPYHIIVLCHEDIKYYSALNSSVMAANATRDVKLNPTIEMSE